ncbi:MAG: Gfo/Idh/MocA family oxidoreductase [Nonomuraea sp.]|nr:Gfo/Idh/MocA family oxidoreductase [Nonomuraea sp.]
MGDPTRIRRGGELTGGPIRWGIIGTANIAARAFLPGLREAGGGAAMAVAGRDGSRADAFAAEHGVDHGVPGYRTLIDDPEIDAVYIALPNHLHADWTIAALEAGKAVLCEKPLCLTATEAERVIAVARRSPRPLWESFVFPFHPQTARLHELLAEGAIGELREIWSAFHFTVRDAANIRLDPSLGGGALYDVGCYPVRLAQLLFDREVAEARGAATLGATRVDVETAGWAEFAPGRLLFSCGFGRPFDTFTRLIGTQGEIRLTNPFHPSPDDVTEVWRDGRLVSRFTAGQGSAFSWAIRHIHQVLGGQEEPRHLASHDSLVTARALDLLYRDVASGPSPRSA